MPFPYEPPRHCYADACYETYRIPEYVARAKDKNARRRLLKKYDDRVRRNKDYAGAYQERGAKS